MAKKLRYVGTPYYKITSAIFTWLFCTISFLSFSQIHSDYPARILEEEANYMVVNDQADRYYLMTVKRKIEILSQAGLEYADIVIPFYHSKTIERIHNISASIENKGVVKDLDENHIIRNKLNDSKSTITISYPNVQVGSILEYEYSLQSTNIVQPRSWEFQHEIPTVKSTAHLNVPSTVGYAYLLKGADAISFESKRVSEGTLNVDGTTSYGHKATLSIDNVPALIKEPFVSTIENYRYAVQFQLDEIIVGSGIQKIIPTWEKLVQEIKENDWMGAQYRRKNNHKTILEALTPVLQKGNTIKEKISDAYHFITHRVAWNGYVHCQTSDKIDDAFKNGSANSGELNMMMMVALEEMDAEWYPILASTAENGFISEKYPLFRQFNHMLILAVVDKEEIFIDLHSPYGKPGEIRASLVNTKGWLADRKNHKFIAFNSGKSIHKSIIDISFNSPDTLAANVIWRAQGYAANNVLHFLDHNNCEKLTQLQFNLDPENLAPGHCNHTHTTDEKNNYVEMAIDFKTSQGILSSGNQFYWTPIWNSENNKQPFKLATRSYPIEFEYLEKEFIKMNVKAPTGYHIHSIPESLRLVIPDHSAKFHFTTQLLPNKSLDITMSFNRDKTRIGAQYYETIKEFYSQIESKLNEPIGFSKTE